MSTLTFKNFSVYYRQKKEIVTAVDEVSFSFHNETVHGISRVHEYITQGFQDIVRFSRSGGPCNPVHFFKVFNFQSNHLRSLIFPHSQNIKSTVPKNGL